MRTPNALLSRMSGQKRRFFERVGLPDGSSTTYIGADSVIVGDVRGSGHFVVSGEIHGDGDLAGALSLSIDGQWHGTIHARQAIVAGRIVGALIVEETLEIGRTAVINGRVSARTIAIATGAIVDGEIEVTSGKPVIQFEEKRKDT
jgi:cytoskeletal protein CcmA (bactofilin family)